MKIVKLYVENIKGIRVAEVVPDGNLVVISGANEAGKSSLIDSIFFAICGTKGHDAMPIRTGATQGKIVVDLGEYVVHRYFTPSSTRLEIFYADGLAYDGGRSPQTLLNRLLGDISFDPMEFLRLKPAEQVAMLLKATPFELDGAEYKRVTTLDPNPDMDALTMLDSARAMIYQRRTAVNQEVASAKERFDQYRAVPPTEEVDVADLLHERDTILAARSDIEKAKSAYEAKVTRFGQLKAEREQLLQRLETIKSEMTMTHEEGNALKPLFVGKAIPSTEDVDLRINTVSETNKRAADYLKRLEYDALFQGKTRDSETLTRRLKAVDALKKSTLENANLPVPGLGFGDLGVTLNDIPIKQLSWSQKIIVSTAIGMASNRELRIMRINDGSLLDKAHMAQIDQLAGEKDFQIWVECVDETGQIGIVIEDGMVKQLAATP